MRGVIWLILLFVAAVVAATALGRNDGLVSLYWGGWRTDLSLNLFLVLVLGSCALLILAVQAVTSLLSLPRRASQWRALRKERAAADSLREAQSEFYAARYARAFKAAHRALVLQPEARALEKDARFGQLAQLLAAGSLHRLQDRSRRDSLLAQALKATGSASAESAQLLSAEWALDDHDAARALEMLDAMAPGAGRRTQALRLRLQASRLARQPMEALRTARMLAKHQAFSPTVAQALLRTLAGELLESAHDAPQLRRLWAQLEGADRRDVLVACRAATRAAQLAASEDARQWLRPFWERLDELSREDREQLALTLIDSRSGIAADWLPSLDSAALAYGHEAAVVAAVGMAFSECQLWGKAQRMLQQAASAPGLPARQRRLVWRELATLARQESDEAAALRCEQAAAAID